MTNIKITFLLLFIFFAPQFLHAQKKETLNLLAGEVQANGLPAGWETSVDNDCTIKFDEDKVIFFERQSPGDKCSFSFTKEKPNGIYIMKISFKSEGNGEGILLNGNPLEKQQTIEVTDGKLSVTIRTKGGKAWGRIDKMTITKKEPNSPHQVRH